MSWDEDACYETSLDIPSGKYGKLIAIPGGPGPSGPPGPPGESVVGPAGPAGPAGPTSLASYASLSAFPATGEAGKVFLAEDTGDTYRWDGTKYVRVSERVLSTGITDSSVVGRKVVVAADEKAGRAALVAERHRTFNVLDYGAVADGVADCRAAIHAARDAAGVGGRLYFPKGTYKIQTLSSGDPAYGGFGTGGLHANVEGQTWLLDQATLVLNGSNRDNLITVTVPNVSIIGGTLDLSAVPPSTTDLTPLSHGIAVWSQIGTAPPLYGPHGAGAAGAVIDGVTILDAPGYAVYVYSTNSVTVTGCTFKDFFRFGVAVHNGTSADNADIHDFLVQGNRMESKWASFAAPIYVGFNDQGGTGFTAKNRRVKYARITDNSCVIPRQPYPGQGSFFGGGAEAGVIQGFNLEDSVIANNATEGGSFGITTGFLRRVTISNNTVRGFRGCGIEVSGGSEDVSVTGNVTDADGAGGPYNVDTGLQDPAGTLNVTTYGVLVSPNSGNISTNNLTVAGNTITGFTAPAKAIGVNVGNSCDGAMVSGNTITGVGGSTGQFSGVWFSGASHANATVTGNTIDGANRNPALGVGFAGSNNIGVSVTGNNISNCTRAAFETAFTTGGVISDFDYRGNLVRNCFMNLRGNTTLITRFFHDVGLVKDTGGNTAVELPAATNAVNFLQLRNAATLGDVAVRALGSDTDVSLNLWPKGAGVVKANNVQVETKGHTHTVAQVTGARSWAAVPASATAAGTAGQEAYDTGFHYVCVTTGAAGAALWKRIPLPATW
jgi:hypothetical protein